MGTPDYEARDYQQAQLDKLTTLLRDGWPCSIVFDGRLVVKTFASEKAAREFAEWYGARATVQTVAPVE